MSVHLKKIGVCAQLWLCKEETKRLGPINAIPACPIYACAHSYLSSFDFLVSFYFPESHTSPLTADKLIACRLFIFTLIKKKGSSCSGMNDNFLHRYNIFDLKTF